MPQISYHGEKLDVHKYLNASAREQRKNDGDDEGGGDDGGQGPRCHAMAASSPTVGASNGGLKHNCDGIFAKPRQRLDVQWRHRGGVAGAGRQCHPTTCGGEGRCNTLLWGRQRWCHAQATTVAQHSGMGTRRGARGAGGWREEQEGQHGEALQRTAARLAQRTVPRLCLNNF
jgi:hypothetical protein